MTGAGAASTFSLSSFQPPRRFQAEYCDVEFFAGMQKRFPYRFSVVARDHQQETKLVARDQASHVCNGAVCLRQIQIERRKLAQNRPGIGSRNQETSVGRKRFVEVAQIADANTPANRPSLLLGVRITQRYVPAVFFGQRRAGFLMPS